MQRNDLLALEFHRFDAVQAQVLDHLQMLEITVAEGHPEAPALYLGHVLAQRLHLLVVEQEHLARADLGEIEDAGDLHRSGGHPVAVLPVAAIGGHLTDVDLRIEVGGEGVAVIAGVAVEDVHRVDAIEVVLTGVGGEDVGYTRVETGTEQGREPGLFESVLIGPLPFVFELGLIRRLVVGGVEIVDPGFQAGVHDGQILVGQGHVDHHLGFDLADQCDQFRHIVSVDLGGLNPVATDLGSDLLALGEGAAGQPDVAEDLWQLGAFVGHHTAYAAGADDQDSTHDGLPD